MVNQNPILLDRCRRTSTTLSDAHHLMAKHPGTAIKHVENNLLESVVNSPSGKYTLVNAHDAPIVTPENSEPTSSSVMCSVPLSKVHSLVSTLTNGVALSNTTSSSVVNRVICLFCERTFVNGNLRQKHVERSHLNQLVLLRSDVNAGTGGGAANSVGGRRVGMRRLSQATNSQPLLSIALSAANGLIGSHITATPCAFCDKFATIEHTLDQLFEHMVQSHPSRYFGCLPCHDRFANASHLTQHNSMHHLLPSTTALQDAGTTTTRALTCKTRNQTLRQQRITNGVALRSSVVKTARRVRKAALLSAKATRLVLRQRNQHVISASSKMAPRKSQRIHNLPTSSQPSPNVTDPSIDTTTPSLTSSLSSSSSCSSSSTSSNNNTCTTTNPYPEFDRFFRVKKITDHSIDNLKIATLTFDDVVFDKAFYSRIRCNIQENLQHYMDGKLFKNKDSETRISNFEKTENPPLVHPPLQPNTAIGPTNDMNGNSSFGAGGGSGGGGQGGVDHNFGCELSSNAATPTTIPPTSAAQLSLAVAPNHQYGGDDPESHIEYAKASRAKKCGSITRLSAAAVTNISSSPSVSSSSSMLCTLETTQSSNSSEPVVHYKYFTRHKYQAQILEQKENRDLSKLDMWTQTVIKQRQQKTTIDGKDGGVNAGRINDEYRNQVRRDELNRILDRRGPLEDLREEATRKATMDRFQDDEHTVEAAEQAFHVIRLLVHELVDKVVVKLGHSLTSTSGVEPLPSHVKLEETTSSSSLSPVCMGVVPAYLQLRRRTGSFKDAAESEIDRSDRIALICSSQEAEYVELPGNSVRNKDEPIELSGEWARSRIYVCAACGLKLLHMKHLIEHRSVYHQHVWVHHYEFVGNQNELYHHLSIPGLGKVGVLEKEPIPFKMWQRSAARVCSKCAKRFNALSDLHRHILECGGDWTWMLARKKCKYRPYGARSRRKRRGLIKRMCTAKNDSGQKKVYKKPIGLPKVRPSDADTIERMLANLPAKRASRNVMSLKDLYQRRVGNTTSNNTKNCQLKNRHATTSITRSSSHRNPSQSKHTIQRRKSLRCINRVISSSIIDTSNSIMLRRRLRRNSSILSDTTSPCNKLDKDTPPSSVCNKLETPPSPPNCSTAACAGKRLSTRLAQLELGKKIQDEPIKNLPSKTMGIKRFFAVKKRAATNTAAAGTTSVNTTLSAIIDASDEKPQKTPPLSPPAKRKTTIKSKNDVVEEKKQNGGRRDMFNGIMRTLRLRKRSVTNSSFTTNFRFGCGSNNKRPTTKLRQSFRKAVSKIKGVFTTSEMDIEPPQPTLLTEDLASVEQPTPHIALPLSDGTDLANSGSVLCPSAPPEPVPTIVVHYAVPPPPIHDTIFEVEDHQKSVQAKGELTHHTRIDSLSVPLPNTDTVTPRLISPNNRSKIRRSGRGLDDCIALLTSKLTPEGVNTSISSIDSLFSGSDPCLASTPTLEHVPEIRTAITKAEPCILKVPTFKLCRNTIKDSDTTKTESVPKFSEILQSATVLTIPEIPPAILGQTSNGKTVTPLSVNASSSNENLNKKRKNKLNEGVCMVSGERKQTVEVEPPAANTILNIPMPSKYNIETQKDNRIISSKQLDKIVAEKSQNTALTKKINSIDCDIDQVLNSVDVVQQVALDVAQIEHAPINELLQSNHRSTSVSSVISTRSRSKFIDDVSISRSELDDHYACGDQVLTLATEKFSAAITHAIVDSMERSQPLLHRSSKSDDPGYSTGDITTNENILPSTSKCCMSAKSKLPRKQTKKKIAKKTRTFSKRLPLPDRQLDETAIKIQKILAKARFDIRMKFDENLTPVDMLLAKQNAHKQLKKSQQHTKKNKSKEQHEKSIYNQLLTINEIVSTCSGDTAITEQVLKVPNPLYIDENLPSLEESKKEFCNLADTNSQSHDLSEALHRPEEKTTTATLLADHANTASLSEDDTPTARVSLELGTKTTSLEDHVTTATPLEYHATIETPLEDHATIATSLKDHTTTTALLADHCIRTTPLEDYVTTAEPLEEHASTATTLGDHATIATPLEDHTAKATDLEDHATKATTLEDCATNTASLEDDATFAAKPLEDQAIIAIPIENNATTITPIEDHTIATTFVEDHLKNKTIAIDSVKPNLKKIPLEVADNISISPVLNRSRQKKLKKIKVSKIRDSNLQKSNNEKQVLETNVDYDLDVNEVCLDKLVDAGTSVFTSLPCVEDEAILLENKLLSTTSPLPFGKDSFDSDDDNTPLAQLMKNTPIELSQTTPSTHVNNAPLKNNFTNENNSFIDEPNKTEHLAPDLPLYKYENRTAISTSALSTPILRQPLSEDEDTLGEMEFETTQVPDPHRTLVSSELLEKCIKKMEPPPVVVTSISKEQIDEIYEFRDDDELNDEIRPVLATKHPDKLSKTATKSKLERLEKKVKVCKTSNNLNILEAESSIKKSRKSKSSVTIQAKVSDEVTELRRSGRNARKKASYNEHEFVDPLLDDVIINGKKICADGLDIINEIENIQSVVSSKSNSDVEDEFKPRCRTASGASSGVRSSKSCKKILTAALTTETIQPEEPVINISTEAKKLNAEELFDMLKASETGSKITLATPEATVVSNVSDDCQKSSSTLLEPIKEVSATSSSLDIIQISESCVSNVAATTTESTCNDESSLNSGSMHNITSTPTIDLPDSTKNCDSIISVNSSCTYCDICNKTFRRNNSLAKHKQTLGHISRLSELESKESSVKSPSALMTEDVISKDAAPCAEIFDVQANTANVVQRYKSMGERKSFDNDSSSVILIAPPLAALPSAPNDSSIAMAEKQISLLENIIEIGSTTTTATTTAATVSSVNKVETEDTFSTSDTSFSCSAVQSNTMCTECNSRSSARSSRSSSSRSSRSSSCTFNTTPTNTTNMTLDDNPRKVLNRDEELFLECCSLLKGSSRANKTASSVPSSGAATVHRSRHRTVTSVAPITTVDQLSGDSGDDEPDWLENKSILLRNHSSQMVHANGFDDSLESSAANQSWNIPPTPSIHNNATTEEQSFTFVEDANMDNKSFTFEEINESDVSAPVNCTVKHEAGHSVRDNFSMFGVALKRERSVSCDKSVLDECSRCSSAPSHCSSHSSSLSSTSSLCDSGHLNTTVNHPAKDAKQPSTSSLRVSIPVDHMNLAHILRNNHIKSHQSSKPPDSQTSLQTKTIISTFSTPSPTNIARAHPHEANIYDFHDTEDSLKPDVSSDNTAPTEDNEDSRSSSSEKTKKCVIMGRIFKTTASKMRLDLDLYDGDGDNERSDVDMSDSHRSSFASLSPTLLESERRVRDYVRNCRPEPALVSANKSDGNANNKVMTQEELDMAFDRLLKGSGTDEPKTKNTIVKKQRKRVPLPKGRPRRPPQSSVAKLHQAAAATGAKGSSDDENASDKEFVLKQVARRRKPKTNTKSVNANNGTADNIDDSNKINLEQELRECIGVASRKSQRKCTSGKQNVLIEYWSSDDSRTAAVAAVATNELPAILAKDGGPQAEFKTGTKKKDGGVQPTRKRKSDTAPVHHRQQHAKKTRRNAAPTKRKNGATLAVQKNSTAYKKNDMPAAACNRRKRSAANPLYHWSSSSEDESPHDLIPIQPIRDDDYDIGHEGDDDDDDDGRPVQHGWIVGESPKKLVTMLAQAKGKHKTVDAVASLVKEQGRKRS